ncbi:MAG: flagellin, partial [Sulfitobacter geojensis]
MSSILTNNSAMIALASLTDVNRNLNETQTRISTG